MIRIALIDGAEVIMPDGSIDGNSRDWVDITEKINPRLSKALLRLWDIEIKAKR